MTGTPNTSEEAIRKSAVVYFLVIAVPLTVMFVIMLLNYSGVKAEEAQTIRLNEEGAKRNLFIIACVMFALTLIWYKWFSKQMTKLREVDLSLKQKVSKYVGVNTMFYIMLSLTSLLPIISYAFSNIDFYVGLYCLLVFVVMPLERPTTRRINRNLKLKRPQRYIINNRLDLDSEESEDFQGKVLVSSKELGNLTQ